MYNSYYNPQRNKNTSKNSQPQNINKSTSQYLFLNTIRAFSIIYLFLTIFYIPVFISIGEINSLYWRQTQNQYSFWEKMLLHGTIFSIKKYEICYEQEPQYIKVKDESLQEQMFLNSENKYCYRMKVNFLPFVSTVEQFHTFYFSYFLIMYSLSFVSVILAQHMNKELYIKLEYPEERSNGKQILYNKKTFHVKYKMNEPIYFVKPILKRRIQQLFDSKISINNINLMIDPRFTHHAELHLEKQRLEQAINISQVKLVQQIDGDVITLIQQQIKKEQLKLQKIAYELSLSTMKTHDSMLRKPSYHYGHFWIHVGTFSDCLILRQYIRQTEIQKYSPKKADSYINSNQSQIKIDSTQKSDLLIDNVQNRQQIVILSLVTQSWQQQFSTWFLPNRCYNILNKTLQLCKILFGIILCLILIIAVDVVILVIQKNDIFSHSTVLIVVIMEILLKIFLVKLSLLQTHSLYSHEKLSIMLKHTIFIFINLVVVLILAHHDLGDWALGKYLSTYQLTQINEQWYLTIGTAIILVVIIQIIFCNLQILLAVLKHILLQFLQRRFFQLIKINRLKQKLTFYIKDFKSNYQKPVIQLEIFYAQLVPIYMIGICFGYLFPVLYPLMFIFSITVYTTHQHYVELQTDKYPYSGTLLNDWAFRILYATFLTGMALVGYVEWENVQIVAIVLGIFIVIWIAKRSCSDLDQMIDKKLQQLTRKQQQITNQNGNQLVMNDNKQTERNLNSELASQIPTTTTAQTKNKLFCSQLKQKQTELTLLQLIHPQRQNLNPIHANYYHQYKQIIKEEIQYLHSQQGTFNNSPQEV